MIARWSAVRSHFGSSSAVCLLDALAWPSEAVELVTQDTSLSFTSALAPLRGVLLPIVLVARSNNCVVVRSRSRNRGRNAKWSLLTWGLIRALSLTYLFCLELAWETLRRGPKSRVNPLGFTLVAVPTASVLGDNYLGATPWQGSEEDWVQELASSYLAILKTAHSGTVRGYLTRIGV